MPPETPGMSVEEMRKTAELARGWATHHRNELHGWYEQQPDPRGHPDDYIIGLVEKLFVAALSAADRLERAEEVLRPFDTAGREIPTDIKNTARMRIVFTDGADDRPHVL